MAKPKSTATPKKTKGKKSREPASAKQVSLSVEPGVTVQITVAIGEKTIKGKVPLTVLIEQTAKEAHAVEELSQPDTSANISALIIERLWTKFAELKKRLQAYDLATWLFIFAIAIYLVTRLIGLTHFPIYFFTDEAIQTQSIIDLIKNGYRDSLNVWLPTYFRNGDYYNLGVSVYLQWLPYILFGKSALLTRTVSVFVTLIAAITTGLVLRDIFKLTYWWTGTLFLSITPAWFLHSRTAFETAEFVALYAGALCAYLFYRYKSPRYLYLTIFLAGLSFYTYSPGQLIIPLTAIGLIFSDWRYHWANRRTALRGLAFGALLALPYIRFSINNPSASVTHLHTLWSYWFEKIPLSEKIVHYLSEFGIGLSPWYWYIPNDRDLPRHLMKDYGNILLITLPFALLGMAHVLRNLRTPACRAVLIALLISPAAAALVQTSITRTLAFVIPAALLTAIGFEQYLQWFAHPRKHIFELGAGIGPNVRRVGMALLILLIGIPIAFISKESINRIALTALTLMLALPVSGILEQLAQFSIRTNSNKTSLWNPSKTIIAVSVFVVLSGINVSMLSDALKNGLLWYRDYGLGGMQYGAFQVFDVFKQYAREHPNTKITFSPDWANGTDVVTRFFLGDDLSIQIGSIRGHITQKLPLDDTMLFIMTPEEFDMITKSAKFVDVQVETVIPYPDGNPGFYFVRLRYAPNIDEIFAAEKAIRQELQEAVVRIDGQNVKLRYSYLDGEPQAAYIALLFDNDPYTVAKTFESNPFIIELTFPTPRNISGLSLIIGSAKVQVTVKCYAKLESSPIIYTFEGQGTIKQPGLSFDLPASQQVQVLRVEVLDPSAPNPTKIHIWELKLR